MLTLVVPRLSFIGFTIAPGLLKAIEFVLSWKSVVMSGFGHLGDGSSSPCSKDRRLCTAPEGALHACEYVTSSAPAYKILHKMKNHVNANQ